MEASYAIKMMNALFGGAEETSETAAIEKRLELDLLSADGAPATISLAMLQDVAVLLNVAPRTVTYAANSSDIALICDRAVIISSGQQLVVTCDGDVAIHIALKPITERMEADGYKVEWGSFLRKNTGCPWELCDLTIAQEYAALKTVFPRGNPFIFGPVDADHYFYFVIDELRRGAAGEYREGDVQLNVKIYNAENVSCFGVTQKEPSVVHFENGSRYEMLRYTMTSDGSIVSFETNANIKEQLAMLQDRVKKSRAERFTVMLLLEPLSDEVADLRADRFLGFEPQYFDTFALLNRTNNTSEHGHVVIKLNYVRI